MAAQLTRCQDTHGNSALFVPYGTGSIARRTAPDGPAPVESLRRLAGALQQLLVGVDGAATATVYGTNVTGNQRQDW